MSFCSIEDAIAALKAGRPVIVVDDEDRENEGDLIFAAELATPELLAFTVRYTSGYICAPLTEDNADRLQLPPMYHTNQDRLGTAYTVTVDAREGVSTGISAADRARTIRLLADPTTTRTVFGSILKLDATTDFGRPACQCCRTSTTSIISNCLLAMSTSLTRG